MFLCSRTLAAVALSALAAATAAAQAPPEVVTFDRDAKPVLRKHCGKCHNAERPRGELDLSTFAGVMAGGASGKVAVPGKPEESPLYTLTAHLEEPAMPPNAAKIPQRDLGILRRWVEGGLRETADGPPASAPAVAEAPPPAPAGGLVAPAPMPRAPAVAALAVSPTAPIAAVPGHRQVLLFNIARGEPLGAVAFPEGEVQALRFSRDGGLLLAAGGVGAESGRAVVFHTGDWSRASAVGDEQDAILAADFNPAATEVVHGGPGRLVKVAALAGGGPRHAFRKATDWITAAGFSPDGLLVAAGDRFGGLFLWEAQSGREFLTLRGHVKAVNALAWLPGGDRLATAGEDGTARVWDLHYGSEAARWDAHAGGALAIDVDRSGRVVTGGRDRRIKVWDATGKALADLGPAADHVTRVAWSGDGRTVVAGDWSGAVRAWDPARSTSIDLPIPVAAKPAVLAAVAPELNPARPSLRVPAAPPAGPAPADDLESALASAREVEAAASRAVARLARLRGPAGSPDPMARSEGITPYPAALAEARAGLQSLRSSLAKAPGHAGLRAAVEAAEGAVRSLEAGGP